MKERLCRRLLEDESLKSLAQKLGGEQWEDVLQEVALLICEYPDLQSLNKSFGYWCSRVIMNMTSRTGQIGKLRHKKVDIEQVDVNKAQAEEVAKEFEYDHDIDDQVKKVNDILNGLYWYDAELFRTYIEEGSLRNVEKKVGIKYGSVHNTVTKVRNIVKDKMND